MINVLRISSRFKFFLIALSFVLGGLLFPNTAQAQVTVCYDLSTNCNNTVNCSSLPANAQYLSYANCQNALKAQQGNGTTPRGNNAGTSGGNGGFTGIQNPVIGELGTDIAGAQCGSTFANYLVVIWRAIISVGGLIVLVFMIWGAIEWIVAGGDSAKVQKGRDRMTQSIIGLVILVGSFAIIGLVSQLFFGNEFNLLQLTFPTAGGGTIAC